MKAPRDVLTLPARRGVRLVALELLADAGQAADRLASRRDAEALHDFRVSVRRLRSWLRAFGSDLRTSARKRDIHALGDIADATNAGRDAEVQLEWLERAAKRASRAQKRGIGWLAAMIREEQQQLDDPLDGDCVAQFAGVQKRLAKALTKKTKRHRRTLAEAIAEQLAAHVDAATASLHAVRAVDDERPAHEARIAVKRLRYLLEPLRDHVRSARAVVDRLTRLQDDLGALHDLHVLGHEIRAALEASAAAQAAAEAEQVLTNGSATAMTSDVAPRDEILDVAERVHREAERVFARVARSWLRRPAAVRKLRGDVASIAERLDVLARR